MTSRMTLKQSFASAMAVVTFGMAASGGALAIPPATSKGRPLTAGELEMFKIFGTEADPTNLVIHAGPPKGTTAAEAFDTKTIAVYGHPHLSLDYSKDDSDRSQKENDFNWGLAYHETTHTWQFQNGWVHTNGICPNGYVYSLKKDSVFSDFCSEAQAAIVEDYSRRYHKPKSARSHWYADTCDGDTPEHDAMLLKIVEDRFPAARAMRLKIGRGEVLPDAKPRPEGAPACPQIKDDDKFVAQKGQPVYFCETLAYAFSNIKGIAFKEGLPAWPGYEATLDKKKPVCTVSMFESKLVILGAKDFNPNGQIKPESMVPLAQELAKYAPQGVLEPVRASLSSLFDNLVEKQNLEKKALREVKNKREAYRMMQALESQLVNDPSLPDNSRGFVKEKIQILKDVLLKLDPNGAKPDEKKQPDDVKPVDAKPDVKKPGTVAPDGKGGGKPVGKPQDKKDGGARPVAPPKPDKPKDTPNSADSNIKDVLDSAFGGKKAKAPAGPKT